MHDNIDNLLDSISDSPKLVTVAGILGRAGFTACPHESVVFRFIRPTNNGVDVVEIVNSEELHLEDGQVHMQAYHADNVDFFSHDEVQRLLSEGFSQNDLFDCLINDRERSGLLQFVLHESFDLNEVVEPIEEALYSLSHTSYSKSNLDFARKLIKQAELEFDTFVQEPMLLRVKEGQTTMTWGIETEVSEWFSTVTPVEITMHGEGLCTVDMLNAVSNSTSLCEDAEHAFEFIAGQLALNGLA